MGEREGGVGDGEAMAFLFSVFFLKRARERLDHGEGKIFPDEQWTGSRPEGIVPGGAAESGNSRKRWASSSSRYTPQAAK